MTSTMRTGNGNTITMKKRPHSKHPKQGRHGREHIHYEAAILAY